MGPIGQNQHFAELRHKVCSSIHDLVLQRGLPGLDGKLERFVKKKMKKAVAKLESDRPSSNGDFRQTCNGNDFSLERATYQPKSILIIFCHL